MNYKQQSGKSIQKAFNEFNKENPKVYMLFCEQCYRAIRRKKEKISSKQILGYIRWEVSLDTHSTDGFKINDAFTAHYARLFAKDYPEHEDLFNFRELRSEQRKGKKTKNKLLNQYQRELLNKIRNGLELWFINKEHKLIHPDTEVQYKVESRSVVKFLKLKFIKIAEQKNKPVKLIEYSITQKALKFLGN